MYSFSSPKILKAAFDVTLARDGSKWLLVTPKGNGFLETRQLARLNHSTASPDAITCDWDRQPQPWSDLLEALLTIEPKAPLRRTGRTQKMTAELGGERDAVEGNIPHDARRDGTVDGTAVDGGRTVSRQYAITARIPRMGTWLDAVRMPALPEGYWMSNAMIYGPASGSEGREAGRRGLMGSGGIIGIDADGAHISCGWRRHMRIMAREAIATYPPYLCQLPPCRRQVTSRRSNRPSIRPRVDGTPVFITVRRRDGRLARVTASRRDGTVVRPSVEVMVDEDELCKVCFYCGDFDSDRLGAETYPKIEGDGFTSTYSCGSCTSLSLEARNAERSKRI
ncbi:hypothetical protein B0H14DRAFT_2598198 [Mycena olivaceomarginata]|nr:hypothetical protein B0H14DRAFT_2598198 [Mycena olivaceomarginata]